MPWRLEEITSQVAPGAHAAIVLDQAGWHATAKPEIPPVLRSRLCRQAPRS